MEELKNLYYREKRLKTNKNLSILAAIFIIFSTVSNGFGAPMYYFISMGLMSLALIAIAIYGHKQVKIIGAEIEKLEAIQAKETEELNKEAIEALSEEENVQD